MCLLPKLNPIKKKMQTISAFKGLNERVVIEDGEFSDCCNISTKEYPAVSITDGYEIYDQFDIEFPKISDVTYDRTKYTIKSKNGFMMVERYCYITGTFNGEYQTKTDYTCAALQSSHSGGFTEWKKILELSMLDLGAKQYIKDFAIYNDFFVAFKSESGGGTNKDYILKYYPDNQWNLISTTEVTSAGFDGCKSEIHMIPFGSRMIITSGNEIHISFLENITDYTTTLVDGSATKSCAETLHHDDDGKFTGCVNYRGYPIFFKENSMYILYGEEPPFSLTKIDTVGCANKDTISICNGKLYFLSHFGVMEYDGGVPELISQKINLCFDKQIISAHTAPGMTEVVYTYPRKSHLSSSACADERNYYIGEYCYDTVLKTWSKRNISPGDFICPQCYFDKRIYAIKKIWDDGYLKCYPCIYCDTKDSPNWHFTTKPFHEYQEGKKIISKLVIGFQNISATALKIEVSLNKGDFQTKYTWDGTTNFVKEIPVMLPPCDYFQLKVSGTGKIIVNYIKREFRVLGA